MPLNPMVYEDMVQMVKDRLVFDASIESPVDAPTLLRYLNDAYLFVWQQSPNRVKNLNSNLIWGHAAGTATMQAGGPHGLAGESGEHRARDAALPLGRERLRHRRRNHEGAVSGRCVGRGSKLREHVEAARTNTTGPYCYAIEEMESSATSDPTSTVAGGAVPLGGFRLWVYPPCAAATFFPGECQRYPTDLAAGRYPDLSVEESRDVPLLAAIRLAPTANRPELRESLAGELTERTRQALMMEALIERGGERPHGTTQP